MNPTTAKYQRPYVIIVDILLMVLSLVLAFYWRYPDKVFYQDVYYLNMLLIYIVVWIVSSYLTGVYKRYRLSSLEKILRALFQSIVIHVFVIVLFWVLSKGFYYSRQILITSYLFIGASLLFWKIGFYYYQLNLRRSGFNLRSVVILGKSEATEELEQFFKLNPQFGFKFKGYFTDDGDVEAIGNLKEVDNYIIENNIDEVYCLVPKIKDQQLENLELLSNTHPFRIKLIPDIKSFYYSKTSMELYGNTPVLITTEFPLDKESSQIIKRLFDIVFSIFVILFVFSWLFPIVAVIIKLESKGPVFFVQKRSGLNYRPFNCFKFRSMKYNKDNVGFKQATKGDSRVTKMGAFIRKTSIDEMPQFFNVLLGDMSVVGPRPHPLQLDETYRGIIDKYMSRHFAKPGITGLSQVMGYRGETKDQFAMKARIKLDTFYIERWSFLLDIKIILLTVYNIFKTEENAY